MLTVIIGAGGAEHSPLLPHEDHGVLLVEKDGRLVERASGELDVRTSC